MSSKAGRTIITCQTKDSESPLPTCNPNLMPFHIKYTGPAAVSMFFHVEKMKAEEGEVKEQNDKKEVLEENPVQTQNPTSTPVSSETSILKDADKRFISSFRGRTIHGLTMDVPTGYTGLLLHGDPQTPTTVSHVDPVLHAPDDSVDNDFEMDEEIPLRKLIPQSTFSSITLWHADRAVDETRDEYHRTLTEWMALSHEVSKKHVKWCIWNRVLMTEIITDPSNGLVNDSCIIYIYIYILLRIYSFIMGSSHKQEQSGKNNQEKSSMQIKMKPHNR
jgi:hypothetical protein